MPELENNMENKYKSLILKYERKVEELTRWAKNNPETTKHLFIVQIDLCNEFLKDLKGETMIKIRSKRRPNTNKKRPARRFK